jgi:tetratricopeptide (TPR) repeat protein
MKKRFSSQNRGKRREESLISLGHESRCFGSCWILILLSLFFSAGALAANVASEFDAANRLYDEGKFSAAANGYETILQSGFQSPALLFNYGNAELKLGEWGRAIVAFRRAEALAPRDSDVRANLQFAREQVEGPTLHASRWENWLGALTLNEWTALAAGALWLTFALFAARQIWPARQSALRGWTRAAVVAAVFLGAGAGAEAVIHFSRPVAVVVASKATVRSGPFDEAQNAFTVHDGAELAVLDQRQDWVQVTDGTARIGWLPRKQVEVLSGG